MTESIPDERALFEAWADSQSEGRLRSFTTGDYDYPLGRQMRKAWEAGRAELRAALAAAPASPCVAGPIRMERVNGSALDEMRKNLSPSMWQLGDCIVCWVNEGDYWRNVQQPAAPDAAPSVAGGEL